MPDLIIPRQARTSIETSHDNPSMYAVAVRQSRRVEKVKISFEVEGRHCSMSACHEALTPGCVPLQRHPPRLRGATVLGKGPVIHTCFFYIRRVGAQLQNLSLPSDLVGGALRDSESTLVTVRA